MNEVDYLTWTVTPYNLKGQERETKTERWDWELLELLLMPRGKEISPNRLEVTFLSSDTKYIDAKKVGSSNFRNTLRKMAYFYFSLFSQRDNCNPSQRVSWGFLQGGTLFIGLLHSFIATIFVLRVKTIGFLWMTNPSCLPACLHFTGFASHEMSIILKEMVLCSVVCDCISWLKSSLSCLSTG